MKLPNWVIPGSAVLFLGACVLLQAPTEQALAIAAEAGFLPVELPDTRLKGFVRLTSSPDTVRTLTIYIESDGAPWRVPDEPPFDPTPHKPMVLQMAASDPGGKVGYLGRPCQYLTPHALAQCDPALWMLGRFSEDAIAATDAALTAMKNRARVSSINLIGYSGGGAIAALVAARRADVKCLVTIAAPLDSDAWTAAIGVSRLSYSLNPADHAGKLRSLRQTHFRGQKDTLVPSATSRRFLAQVPGARVIDKSDYDHQCCWKQEWAELRTQSCLAN
ncbi:MAG: alpha/beta hydrolase [Rhodocyclales bacterium]|nr:alpha/beta hydrolase [Rhodocyclales bacterium]